MAGNISRQHLINNHDADQHANDHSKAKNDAGGFFGGLEFKISGSGPRKGVDLNRISRKRILQTLDHGLWRDALINIHKNIVWCARLALRE